MLKTMWNLAKSSNQQSVINGTRSKETISEELHGEVRSAAPGARLSYILRNSLERLDKLERKEIVSIVGRQDGCAPLFVACKKGNLEIVEYLIENCGADVEQKGTYEVVDDKTSHRVSPLWCAAVSGRLPIVKCLVKHGANVNCVSDTGSTPVRSACFMTHSDIVQYLVEQAGADIQLPNFNGGTCLINSVQSSELCEYLLTHGANVNSQDIQLKTALHYAIQEHRFETTKLLLSHGADPFLKNRYGDDALQTSCLKGATLIFNYLLETTHGYSLERQAEMHELMGSTFLDEHHDIQMALSYWGKAFAIRGKAKLQYNASKPRINYTPFYAYIFNPDGKEEEMKEFETKEDLDRIATDLDQMRITSLLIAERILGLCHKDVIFRIMYRGAAYADSSQYSLCIRLWRYALQLRIHKDSLLYGDTCFTALALIRLYLDLDRTTEWDREGEAHPLQFDDLMDTFSLLIDQLPLSARLVRIKPVFKRQQESFDRCLRCCTHLLYLLVKRPRKTNEQILRLKKVTETFLRYGLKMCINGDSVLHMVVSKNNVVRSHFFIDDHQVCVFPNYDVAKFLIDCGGEVNALNEIRSTPLHHVVGVYNQDNFDFKIAKLLLEHGAHIDQLDINNQSALPFITNHELCEEMNPFDYVSLKCISSRAVCKYGIPVKPGDLPKELEDFVELHRPRELVNPEDGGSGRRKENGKQGNSH